MAWADHSGKFAPHTNSAITVARKVAVSGFLKGTNKFLLLQWSKKGQISSPPCTARHLGDDTPSFFPGAEMAGSPTSGICHPTQNTELCSAPCFGALGPPPPYEEILKANWFYPDAAAIFVYTVNFRHNSLA